MKNYLFASLLLVLCGCASPTSVGEIKEQYIASHSPSAEVAGAIREGRLVKGMTPEEVETAFRARPNRYQEAFFGQIMELQSERSDGISFYTLTRPGVGIYNLWFRDGKLFEWSVEHGR